MSSSFQRGHEIRHGRRGQLCRPKWLVPPLGGLERPHGVDRLLVIVAQRELRNSRRGGAVLSRSKVTASHALASAVRQRMADDRGYTVMHHAAGSAARALLDYSQARVRLGAPTPRTRANTLGMLHDHERCAEYLVRNCRHHRLDVEKCTPLHWAAIKGTERTVKVLIRSDAISAGSTGHYWHDSIAACPRQGRQGC